jgi:DNA-binding SARP family transcriptional activator
VAAVHDCRVKRPSARLLARGLAALSVLLAVGALVLTVVNLGTQVPSGPRARPGDLPLTVALLTFALVGVVVAARRPGNAIGWLLIAEGLVWTLALFCQGYVAFAVYTRPGSLPLPELAAMVVASVWVPAIMLVPVVLLLFPDGRPPSARWRPVVGLAAGVGIVLWTASVLRPGPLVHVRGLENPLGVASGAELLDGVIAVCSGLASVVLVVSVGSLVVRVRRAGAIERRQLAWLGWAAGLVLAGAVIAQMLEALGVRDAITSYFNTVPLTALPVAVGVAVLRHRLYQIEVVVDRTLVAAGLVGFVTFVYLVLVAGVGAAIASSAGAQVGLATLATAIVAVAFQPLRARLHRHIDRLVYRAPIAEPAAPAAPVEPDREPAPSAAPPAVAVVVRTLGGFRIFRDGDPVPASAWQSKKARTLLKVLIARRGRPTPREALMELLWPDDDPLRLANRLSVALATLRAVLDPVKHHPPEYFVTTDREAVRLELAHVSVDVERFLEHADAGLAAQRGGQTQEALAHFEAAEALYVGEFLEEDAYEDWASAVREDAIASYASVLRALGEAALARGDHDAVVRYQLRIIERDAWDEGAHLDLICCLQAAGRHGEARRRYGAYVARMREIDLPAAGFPAQTAS